MLLGVGGNTDLHQFLVERTVVSGSGLEEALCVLWWSCPSIFLPKFRGKNYLRPPEHIITERVLYVPHRHLDHDSSW